MMRTKSFMFGWQRDNIELSRFKPHWKTHNTLIIYRSLLKRPVFYLAKQTQIAWNVALSPFILELRKRHSRHKQRRHVPQQALQGCCRSSWAVCWAQRKIRLVSHKPVRRASWLRSWKWLDGYSDKPKRAKQLQSRRHRNSFRSRRKLSAAKNIKHKKICLPFLWNVNKSNKDRKCCLYGLQHADDWSLTVKPKDTAAKNLLCPIT